MLNSGEVTAENDPDYQKIISKPEKDRTDYEKYIVANVTAKTAKPCNNWLKQAPNLIVKAGAGTGKTFCITEGVHRMMQNPRKTVGSEEQQLIWQAMCADEHHGNIHMTSFTTDASEQLAERCPVDNRGKQLVSASSTYSMGCRFAKKAGHAGTIDQWKNKYKGLTTEWLGGNRFETKDRYPDVWNAVFELQEKARLDLRKSMTEQEVSDLADHYSIDFGRKWIEKITEGINVVLEAGRNLTWKYDFTDMVYIPVINGMVQKTFGTLVVDEFQDMGRAQQELCTMAGWKLILIGDPHQAIYGFAGADHDAFNRIDQFLGMTLKGVDTYPLNMTRRCAKRIVDEANKLLPEGSKLVPLPNAPEGQVVTCDKSEFEGNHLKHVLSKYNPATISRNDLMIICPTNAPLIRILFKLAKQNVRAFVQGLDITESMQRFVATFDIIEDLRKGIAKKLDQLLERKPSKTTATQIDIYLALEEIAKECTSPEDVRTNISNLFSDNPRPGWIRLSSIHRSKGLEAKTVVLWEYNNCYSKYSVKEWQHAQDNNLLYVGRTRSMTELYQVKST